MTNLLSKQLNLDDFILTMLQVPLAQLQLEQLQDWVARLTLKDDLFDRHYARPLKVLTVYCPKSGQTQWLPVHHSE